MLVLERAIADGDLDRLIAAHAAAHARQELIVDLWRRQRPHAKLPGQHGVQNRARHLFDSLGRQGGRRRFDTGGLPVTS